MAVVQVVSFFFWWQCYTFDLVLSSDPCSGFWTLDPIDGTKGFLRGEQYAVCLALIADARVELGVIGCPNLPVSASDPSGERGCIFVATRGGGAYQIPLSASSTTEPRKLMIPAFAKEELNLLESVEKAHGKLSFNDKVAQVLGITREPTRMDSQAKYCSLVRGDGGVYLRMPTGTGYREKIWVCTLCSKAVMRTWELNDRLCLFRIMLLELCLLKRLEGSSLTLVANHSILVLGAHWARTMVLWLLARKCIQRCSKR
jgi:hypothetical protein